MRSRRLAECPRIQHGNNRQPCFFTDEGYHRYLDWLTERERFRYDLEPGMVDEIRRATNGNFALGSERFASQASDAIGRRAMPGRSGRPRKPIEPESGELF